MGVSPSKKISPKVAASTSGSALAVVLAWLAAQVPFIANAPAEVQAALVVLVVSGVTFVSGYLRHDPARG